MNMKILIIFVNLEGKKNVVENIRKYHKLV